MAGRPSRLLPVLLHFDPCEWVRFPHTNPVNLNLADVFKSPTSASRYYNSGVSQIILSLGNVDELFVFTWVNHAKGIRADSNRCVGERLAKGSNRQPIHASSPSPMGSGSASQGSGRIVAWGAIVAATEPQSRPHRNPPHCLDMCAQDTLHP
jgi:hypothetical protein